LCFDDFRQALRPCALHPRQLSMIACYWGVCCQPFFPTKPRRAQLSDKRLPDGYPPLQPCANLLRVPPRCALRGAAERMEGRSIVALHEPSPAICKATPTHLKLRLGVQRADFVE